MVDPIAVCLGDIHLDPKIWSSIDAVRGDAELGYRSFISAAITLGVPAVIVGDLFDTTKPTPDLVAIHRRQMDRCEKAGIPVYFIQGNHDLQPTPWASALHDWPQYVGSGEPFQLGRRMAVGFDYSPKDDIKASLEGSQKKLLPSDGKCLLFLHQAVRQALGFENAWNCDLNWVPEQFELTVIGDIHKPMDFTLSGTRRACYTGPGHARDITQIGPKSCVVVNDDLSYYRHPMYSRLIKRFTVLDNVGVVEVAEWLNEACGSENKCELPPFAWIHHSPEMSTAFPALYKEFVETRKAIIHRDKVLDSQDAEELQISQDSEDVSVPELLNTLVSRDKEPELHNFILNLLEPTVDPVDVLLKKRAATNV